MKNKSSSRLVLVAISALFILPLILAWMLFKGTISMEPVETRNLGRLVQPPIAVDWQGNLAPLPGEGDTSNSETAGLFTDHWTVVHIVPGQCLSSCLQAVRGLRQVHMASGRDQVRIRIALFLPNSPPDELAREFAEIYPKFQLFQVPDRAIREVLESTASDFSAQSAGSSYLIDPIGNIMMFYPAGYDPNDLNKDLKRLLKWSKLDKPS